MERIRARHDGNEQAVEMCKVEMRMVHTLVEMGVVHVMVEMGDGGGSCCGDNITDIISEMISMIG